VIFTACCHYFVLLSTFVRLPPRDRSHAHCAVIALSWMMPAVVCLQAPPPRRLGAHAPSGAPARKLSLKIYELFYWADQRPMDSSEFQISRNHTGTDSVQLDCRCNAQIWHGSRNSSRSYNSNRYSPSC
jgi:hypothetical protein